MRDIAVGMMAQDSVDSSEGCFGEFPQETIERVLSFLPAPVLCRWRSVCKAWNEILCKPSFHNCRDLNGKREACLFLTRYTPRNFGGDRWGHRIDPLLKRRTTFLDVDARRWYSIKADDESCADKFDTMLVSMNDGLVCELARLAGDGGDHVLFIGDPVANTRIELPALPTHSDFWADDINSPLIVITVDNVACSFRVFLLVYTKEAETEMHVYESVIGGWRGSARPPKEQGLAEAASAVILHGILYVVFDTPHPNVMCSLLSYNIQEDTWTVLSVNVPKCSRRRGPDLDFHESNNELWMTRWYHKLEHSWMEDHLYFEAANIQIKDNSSVEIWGMPLNG